MPRTHDQAASLNGTRLLAVMGATRSSIMTNGAVRPNRHAYTHLLHEFGLFVIGFDEIFRGVTSSIRELVPRATVWAFDLGFVALNTSPSLEQHAPTRFGTGCDSPIQLTRHTLCATPEVVGGAVSVMLLNYLVRLQYWTWKCNHAVVPCGMGDAEHCADT